jgi:hypothetical protein
VSVGLEWSETTEFGRAQVETVAFTNKSLQPGSAFGGTEVRPYA